MKRTLYRFALSLLFLWFTPSIQVMISPCSVETIVAQPYFGTSLPKRELVQIVQIPPVFTQTVIVEKCLNASSEISGAQGNHFLCKQRYSSVEVYIVKTVDVLNESHNNTSPQGILGQFKAGKFIRELVLIEAGCHFTFNLLPLFTQQTFDATNQPTHLDTATQAHDIHFLKSPYHHPDQITQSYLTMKRLEHANSQQLYPPKKLEFAPEAQTTTTATYTTQRPFSTFPSTYPQGGNPDQAVETSNEGTAYTAQGTKYYPPVPVPDASPLSEYRPRGQYGEETIAGRAYPGDYPSSEPTSSHKIHSSTPSTPLERPVLTFSNKIGLPLYILSPKADPLLSNIETLTTN